MAFMLTTGRYFGSTAVTAAAPQRSLGWLTCALEVEVLRLPEAQVDLPVKGNLSYRSGTAAHVYGVKELRFGSYLDRHKLIALQTALPVSGYWQHFHAW